MLAASVESAGTPVVGQACKWCGAPYRLEAFEIFDGHHFLLDSCCEAGHKSATDVLQDPDAGAVLLRALGAEHIIGERLRRVADDGCGSLVLDWHPRIVPIAQSRAKAFVREHHRHSPHPPHGWRFGAGLKNGTTLIGVIMVGRPVSRLFDSTTTVEVSRLCLSFEVPHPLRWNVCSMAYSWAAREAFKRGFKRVQTYTLASECVLR